MTANLAYDALMDEICVDLGFCGSIKDGKPLHVARFIPSRGPVTAEQFAEWVFLADDMNPNSEPKRWENLRDKIKHAFVRHMGAEVVDAKMLKWSDGKSGPRKLQTGPIFRKLEVWRRLSAERAIRYNCIQHVQTGEYRVCTADFVGADGALDDDQARYFVEALLATDRSDPEPQEWFSTLEAAIVAHDEAFAE
jgi:hypothetical protein